VTILTFVIISQEALEQSRGAVPKAAAGGVLLWVRRLWKKECQSMNLAELELHPPRSTKTCCQCGQDTRLRAEHLTVTCYTRDDGICKATATVRECSDLLCGAVHYPSFW
jgi:hypothetical protein